jgi:hypothetical protein
MEYLPIASHASLTNNQNYILSNFEYDRSAILEVLQSVSVVDVVAPCNSQINVKISNILKNTLPVAGILYFRINPATESVIHIDKNLDKLNQPTPKFALNLPLRNSDQVLMRWFSNNLSDSDIDVFVGPNGTTTPLLAKQNATCIDETYYTKPCIVKIDDWHSVENQSTSNVAEFISIRFSIPLQLLVKKFS